MLSDNTYLATCEKNLGLLLKASGGNWAGIPGSYLSYFEHSYADGHISLVPSVSCFSNTEFLDSWQVEEAIETLMKVDPDSWPSLEDIEDIDVESLLSGDSVGVESEDFVEDNLGTSEKTERVLKAVIESVIGSTVKEIRSQKGKYPSPENNFLQQDDGTFVGTFKVEDLMFNFEVLPTESGWVCTYRLEEKSLSKLEEPEFKGQREKQDLGRRAVRTKAWGL